MASSSKLPSASLSDPVICALMQTEGEISSKVQIIPKNLLVSRVNSIMYYKTKALNNCTLRAAGIDVTGKICQSCTLKFLILSFPSDTSRHCREQIAPLSLEQLDLIQSKGCSH